MPGPPWAQGGPCGPRSRRCGMGSSSCGYSHQIEHRPGDGAADRGEVAMHCGARHHWCASSSCGRVATWPMACRVRTRRMYSDRLRSSAAARRISARSRVSLTRTGGSCRMHFSAMAQSIGVDMVPSDDDWATQAVASVIRRALMAAAAEFLLWAKLRGG